MKKKKQIPGDDGKVISKMNVEGMPWYSPHHDSQSDASEEKPELSFGDKVALARGVTLAVLLVMSVFALAFLAFILFCIFIWF